MDAVADDLEAPQLRFARYQEAERASVSPYRLNRPLMRRLPGTALAISIVSFGSTSRPASTGPCAVSETEYVVSWARSMYKAVGARRQQQVRQFDLAHAIFALQLASCCVGKAQLMLRLGLGLRA